MNFAITLGGWYQRTTLHLTEIYDFLAFGKSHPELDFQKLHSLHTSLNLKNISRQAGYLEFIQAQTQDNITIRYYEDGLYILELTSPDIKTAENLLKDYFYNIFEPAIAYIFSLGAPIPKILANITSNHPVAVSAILDKPEKLEITSEFGNVYSEISSKGITVYKTPEYIFVASAKKLPVDIVEMQIFFREFKDQLAKYLTIHRQVWEDISKIKDRKTISGSEITPLKNKLDGYQKTVSLIGNRINQMGTYINTRANIAKSLNIEDHLKTLFQYKFEILQDTLSYIKEIWSMTREYQTSAIQVMNNLETQATTNSIRSLQIITSIGVVSGVITYLTKADIPKITSTGIFYFALLILVTTILNITINYLYKKLRYPIKFIDRQAV